MEVAPGSRSTFSGPSSPGPGYVLFRIVGIITLIACFACLAQAMSIFSGNGVPTPSAVMYMFAVGIIGMIWSLLILVTFLRANNVSYAIVFFDFVGTVLCIAGVAVLTQPAIDECAAARAGVRNEISRTDNIDGICGLLRVSWGLALANILFFFLCCVVGWQIVVLVADEYRRLGGPLARRTVIEEGYPTRPAVRKVRQTTTASVPLGGGDRSSKRYSTHSTHSTHRNSRSDRSRQHASMKEKNRRSYATDGTTTDYYSDKGQSKRGSRYY